MSYVLEGMSENERLEYQAIQRNYNPVFDFQNDELCLAENSIVVDAGCGSGVVSRLVAKNNLDRKIKIFAIDNCAKHRLEDAKARSVNEGILSIFFKKGDIRKLEFENNSVDMIISRFVYEHNPSSEAFKEITQEAYRVLKPNGVYYVIDADGVLANIKSDNKDFMSLTQELLEGISDVFEPYPCRKLPNYLTDVGFKFSTPRHIPMIFFDMEDLRYENELWKMRFNLIGEKLNYVLKDKAKWYMEQFFKELWNREHLFYYNRFVFKAYK